ncbi:MAG: hypothetical protein ABW221_26530 [Vicinamibacteria bacterium]
MTAESGEGKLGGIITLLLMAAIGLACWNIIPVYFANSSFNDKMVEMARRPRGFNNTDDEIMRQLEKEARALKIEDFINARTCKIATMDFRRKINCDYDRTVTVLPGFNYTFKFRNEADQPVM